MNPDPSPDSHAPSSRLTLEDRALKYIEGHNLQIWAGIAVLAVLVVIFR